MKLDTSVTDPELSSQQHVVVRRVLQAAHFTQLPNTMLRDPGLDDEARGLLCRLLSHDDKFLTEHYHAALSAWKFEKHQAEKAGCKAPHGRHWYENVFTRLTKAGYKTNTRHQRPDGTWMTVITFCDTADRSPENRGTGNRGNRKEDDLENTPDSSSHDDEGRSLPGESPPSPSASQAAASQPARPREDRGRADWAKLAVQFSEEILPDANPRRIAARFRAAARQHKISYDDLFDVIIWWWDHKAPDEFGRTWKDDKDGKTRLVKPTARKVPGATVRFEDRPDVHWIDVSSPAAWFWTILPDLARAWVDAGHPADGEQAA